MYAACAEYFQDGKGRAYEPRTANNLANTLFWQKWFGAVEAAICNGVCAVCCMHGAIGCGLCLPKEAVTLPH